MDDVGSLRSFSFTISFSDLPLWFSLIGVISGGSACVYFIPIIHSFLLETFFIVEFLVCSPFLGNLFAKCHMPYVLVVMNGLIIL